MQTNPLRSPLRSANNDALRLPVRSDSLAVEQHTYPPLPDGSRQAPGHVPASSVSSFHSVSLSSDRGTADDGEDNHTHIATFPTDRENGGESGDANSLDESFENVSSTCAVSPTTASTLAFDWGEAMNRARQLSPPKLPQRPSSKSPSSVSPPAPTPLPRSVPTSPKLPTRSISSSIATTPRHAPPPPPSIPHHPPLIGFTPRSSRASFTSASASDRSSIISNATTTSRTSTSTRASTQTTNKLSRPTPVPPAAQKRYAAVFIGNIIQRRKDEKLAAKKADLLTPLGTRKSRAAAGWRGLSVDLITNPDDHPVLSKEEEEDVDTDVEPDARIDARSVKLIWCTL